MVPIFWCRFQGSRSAIEAVSGSWRMKSPFRGPASILGLCHPALLPPRARCVLLSGLGQQHSEPGATRPVCEEHRKLAGLRGLPSGSPQRPGPGPLYVEGIASGSSHLAGVPRHGCGPTVGVSVTSTIPGAQRAPDACGASAVQLGPGIGTGRGGLLHLLPSAPTDILCRGSFWKLSGDRKTHPCPPDPLSYSLDLR